MDFMPPNGEVDHPTVRLDDSPHQGEIHLFDFPLFELIGKGPMGHLSFCHKNQARGVLVQPVDDPRPFYPADASKIRAMVQQCVHQRSREMTGRRMNHHSGWLIDDHHAIVFIHDIQGNGFCGKVQRSGFRDTDLDDISRLYLVLCADRNSVDRYIFQFDQPFDLRPAYLLLDIG